MKGRYQDPIAIKIHGSIYASGSKIIQVLESLCLSLHHNNTLKHIHDPLSNRYWTAHRSNHT